MQDSRDYASTIIAELQRDSLQGGGRVRGRKRSTGGGASMVVLALSQFDKRSPWLIQMKQLNVIEHNKQSNPLVTGPYREAQLTKVGGCLTMNSYT